MPTESLCATAERVRNLKVQLAAFAVGIVGITSVWGLLVCESTGSWPNRTNATTVTTWTPWKLAAMLPWAAIVAISTFIRPLETKPEHARRLRRSSTTP
jgi:hypothetical protein